MPCWILAALLVLPQETDSRRAFEAAIRAGDEKALEAAKDDWAKAALDQVRAHKKFGDAYPAVKLVTFAKDKAPFQTALEEFASTLGLPLAPSDPLPKDFKPRVPENLTVNIQDVYPLEAMQKFAAAAGGSMWIDQGRLKFSPFGGFGSNHVFWRNFSLGPDSVNEERVISPFGNTRKTYVEIRFIHDGAPRIAAIKGVRVDVATEDTGRSLVPGPEEGWGIRHGEVLAGSSYPVRVPLLALSPAATGVKRLKGAIEFLLPQEPAYVELPLTDGAEISAEGTTIKVTPEAGGAYLVSCSIADPSKRHVQPRPSDFHVKSKDGDWKSADMAMAGPPNAAVRPWRLTPPPGFKAVALRIRVFKSLGELSVPFEFKDIAVR